MTRRGPFAITRPSHDVQCIGNHVEKLHVVLRDHQNRHVLVGAEIPHSHRQPVLIVGKLSPDDAHRASATTAAP